MSKTEIPSKSNVAMGDPIRILCPCIPDTGIKIPEASLAIVTRLNDKELEKFGGYCIHAKIQNTEWEYGGQDLGFRSTDFQLAFLPIMSSDFDLEDLELAQMIMDEMKDA